MEGRMSIPVKVSGNPASNSGWSVLIELNNPNFKNDDISYSGFENCPYFFSIKTEDKQTIYRLKKNGVRSYGASRGGSLIIAFSIPYGFKLDGGKTPYDVLCRFKDEFLKMGMTAQSDDVYQYKFNSSSAYANILDSTVKEFSLVRETAVRHFPMKVSKTGLIIRPEEEIKKFFEDITYPEFAEYGEILVATQCSSPNYSPLNIKIPRPKKYEVYVDGGFWKIVDDFYETIPALSDQNSTYYNNQTTTFTIAKLLEGTQIKGVRINKNLERVDVNKKELEAVERTEFVDVDIRPADKRGGIDTSKLILDSNGTRLNLQNGKIVLRGRGIDVRIQKSHINAYYQGEDLDAKWEGERLVIVVKEKPKPQPVHPQNVNNGGRPIANGTVTFTGVHYTIKLPHDFFKEDNVSQDVMLKEEKSGGEKIQYFKEVTFEKKGAGYEGTFSVPNELSGTGTFVIKTKKKTYESRVNNNNRVAENFEPTKMSAERKIGYIYLILILLTFLLGCAVGYFFLANNNGITFNNKKVAFLNDAKLKLESVDLTIAQIDSIYGIYRSDKKKYQGRDADICSKINYYYELSEGIKGGSVQKINTCIKSNHISEVHIGFINRIVRDEQSKKWFEGKQYQGIENLKDIEKIYEHYCDDCKKYFEDEGTINNHKKILCNWYGKNGKCQEKFCTEAGLRKHQDDAKHISQPQTRNNSSGNTYTCKKCNKKFSNQKGLEDHMKKEHNER